jgi:hypothetical protein
MIVVSHIMMVPAIAVVSGLSLGGGEGE